MGLLNNRIEVLETQIPFNRKSRLLAGGAIAAAIVLLVLLTMWGPDVSAVKRGDATVYTGSNKFSFFFGAVGFLVGVMAIAFWMNRRRQFRFFAIVLGIMSVLVLFNSPTGFNHRLVVGPESFDLLIGAWYLPRETKFEFASLNALSVRKSEDGSYELVATKKTGDKIAVPLGNLVKAALPRIFEYAEQNGVNVPKRRTPVRNND